MYVFWLHKVFKSCFLLCVFMSIDEFLEKPEEIIVLRRKGRKLDSDVLFLDDGVG